jgi:hemerythrin superfamily protein
MAAKKTASKKTARKTTSSRAAASRGSAPSSASGRSTSSKRGGTSSSRSSSRTSSRSSSRASTASKNGRAASGRALDALKMLRADHDRVLEMFERYEGLRSSRQKEKLAREICDELTVHTTLEEELFYPAVREAIKDDDLMDEANVEHQAAKELISQIEAGSPDEEMYDAKVKVLGEYIKHHIKEEQNEMFSKVRKTDLDLVAMGERMKARKEELVAQLV